MQVTLADLLRGIDALAPAYGVNRRQLLARLAPHGVLNVSAGHAHARATLAALAAQTRGPLGGDGEAGGDGEGRDGNGGDNDGSDWAAAEDGLAPAPPAAGFFARVLLYGPAGRTATLSLSRALPTLL